MKTGAGLTFTIAPDCGYEILQTTNPEAMFIYGGEKYVEEIPLQEDAVYGIGPGLDKDISTQKALLEFLKTSFRATTFRCRCFKYYSEIKKTSI